MPSMQPVSVAFSPDGTRAPFRLFHPKGNSLTLDAAAAARSSLLGLVRAQLPRLERLYLEDLMQTADAVEGITAFLEKRSPRWSGR